jgi:hypothetical protein
MLGSLETAAGGTTSLQGGAGGSAGPSTASSNSGFDSSGWTVDFGDGSANSGGSSIVKWAMVAAVAGGLLWYLYKRRR